MLLPPVSIRPLVRSKRLDVTAQAETRPVLRRIIKVWCVSSSRPEHACTYGWQLLLYTGWFVLMRLYGNAYEICWKKSKKKNHTALLRWVYRCLRVGIMIFKFQEMIALVLASCPHVWTSISHSTRSSLYALFKRFVIQIWYSVVNFSNLNKGKYLYLLIFFFIKKTLYFTTQRTQVNNNTIYEQRFSFEMQLEICICCCRIYYYEY